MSLSKAKQLHESPSGRLEKPRYCSGCTKNSALSLAWLRLLTYSSEVRQLWFMFGLRLPGTEFLNVFVVKYRQTPSLRCATTKLLHYLSSWIMHYLPLVCNFSNQVSHKAWNSGMSMGHMDQLLQPSAPHGNSICFPIDFIMFNSILNHSWGWQVSGKLIYAA